MRKAVLILTSVFTALGSGFVLPFRASKVPHNHNSSESKLKNEKSSKVLLEKISDINENELYQNIDGKVNNVNERSFILITKNLKKVFPDQFFKKSNLVRGMNRSILSDSFLQGYAKSQRSEMWMKSSQHQLLNPKSPYLGRNNQLPIDTRNRSLDNSALFKMKDNKTKENTSKLNETDPKRIEISDDRHVPTYLENYKKTGNSFDKQNTKYSPNKARRINDEPSLFHDKMRILSHTYNRLPKYSHRCAFMKSKLDRKTFLKRYEVSNTVQNYNKESNTKPLHEESVDVKIEALIKDTLLESRVDNKQEVQNKNTKKTKRITDLELKESSHSNEQDSHSESDSEQSKWADLLDKIESGNNAYVKN